MVTVSKRVLAALAAFVALATPACTGGSDADPPETAPETAPETTPTVHVDSGVDVATPPEDGDIWVPTLGPPGGMITTIAIDPLNPDRLYAGGQGGAIFVTDDSGGSWASTEVFAPQNREIIEILVNPMTPSTLYALVGWGSLYVSHDSGASWGTAYESSSDVGLRTVGLSPVDPASLIVGGGTSIAISEDGGSSWTTSLSPIPDAPVGDVAAGVAGEFWATVDGEASRLFHTTNWGGRWEQVTIGAVQPAGTGIFDLWVDPTDTETVFLGLVHLGNLGGSEGDASLVRTENSGASWEAVRLPGPPVGGLIVGQDPTSEEFYATSFIDLFRSADGGDRWEPVGLPRTITVLDPIQLVVDPRDGDILYLPTRAEGVAKSTDKGQTWEVANNGINANTSALLATGVSENGGLLFANGGPGLYRSPDWGQSWDRVDKPEIYHPFLDEIVVNPHDPSEVWVITDAGHIWVSSDGGDSWVLTVDSREGGSGFRFGSIYAMQVAVSDPEVMYAVKAGFGIYRTDNGGETWRFLRDSEVDYSYTIAIDPTDPGTVFGGSNPKPFQDSAMVRRSLDAGETWDTVLALEGAGGVTSVVIDPTDPTTVYAAGPSDDGGSLSVSRDGGDSWEPMSGLDFTNIHFMAARPGHPDQAAAALWGGGVFYTWDGGLSWTEIEAPTVSASGVSFGGAEHDVLYLADRNAPLVYRAPVPGEALVAWPGWEPVLDAGEGHYRVLAAAVSGSGDDVVYASVFNDRGSPLTGTVFRVDESGTTDVTFNLDTLPVALAADPIDPMVAYAVVHTAGGGVYRLDGDNWTLLTGAESGIPQAPALGFSGIEAVLQDGETVLYLLGGSDAAFSGSDITRTGADPADLFTVYRSVDRGRTWVNLDDGHFGPSSGPIKGLAVDGDRLFIASTDSVFSSINRGATWADVGEGLVYTPTAGVALSADGSTLFVPTLGGGMFTGAVNSDGSVSWDQDSRLAAQVEHVQLVIGPADPGRLYATAYPGGVFASDDGGATWTERNFGLPSFVVGDPLREGYYALAPAPSDADVVYLGMYGVGVYRSVDGTQTWQALGDESSPIWRAPVTAVTVDPADADHVFAATEDGVFESADGGGTWVSYDTGLGTTDVRTIAVDGFGRLLAGTKGYEIYASSMENPSWNQLGAFGNWGAIWPIWDDRPLYQYTALLFHADDPDLIHMGTFPAGIFRSTDGGQTWRESNAGWKNDGVFSLVAHPDDPDVIYAGTYNGLNRSADGGYRWETWDTGWPEQQWVFSIAFDPRNPDVMYACSKNGENEGRGSEAFRGTVMKSVDGGRNWSEITAGLDVTQEFYSVAVDPNDPDTVYLATQERGVWISHDGAETAWSPWNDGLTNLNAGSNGNNVTDNLVLSPDGKYLYFGTAGSGVFRRQIG